MSTDSPRMPHHSYPDDNRDRNESPYLPESLLEEILVRLPVKSIFRSKCVCKSWLFRLSDPSFARKYRSVKMNFTPSWTLLYRDMHKQEEMHEQKKLCSLSSDGFISPTISSLYLPSIRVNKILASSNGLLLCRDHKQGIHYICNPFTQQRLSLPQPVTRVGHQVEGLLTQMDGLGVTIKSYKVVQVRSFDCNMPCYLDVFCSESGAWTTYKLYPPYNPKHLGSSPYYNFSTSISLKETLYVPDYDKGVLITYSPYVDPSKLHLIHLPDRDNEEQDLGQPRFRRIRICGTCRGRLRYYTAYLADRDPIQKVWELANDEEGEWCLVHSDVGGSNNDVWLTQSLSSQKFWPISFDPFDYDLMYFWKGGCIHSYHMATRKLQVLRRLERGFVAHLSWSRVIPYELQTWPIPIPSPTWTMGETQGQTQNYVTGGLVVTYIS